MSYRLIQKSKSVAQIINGRQLVAEIRWVRDGFKLIQNGESLGVFSTQQAAWDHFAQPIRERNAEVRAHNRAVRAQHEARVEEDRQRMLNSDDPTEREMADLLGKLGALEKATRC